MYKDLIFVYLQPRVNKNSQNLAILSLQFDGCENQRLANFCPCP